MWYHLDVDRHHRTLRAIFEKRAGIPWADIEKMLRRFGAELSEGRGSRVRVVLNGVRAVFHRPHPEKETDCGAVAAMRRFLVEAGIEVEGEDNDL
jgi:Mn-dependent DtxR family transcriptional regulator